MPLDRSIKKILVIGSGPTVIGQACEFDYAGTQGCKALREEGCRVILLNSNPATIMTDASVADGVYIEPILPHIIEKIVQRERPDALLPTLGGQTALNCTQEIARSGVLQKYDLRLLGITLETLQKAENRRLFKEQMQRSGIAVPRSVSVTCWDEVFSAHKELGFPLMIRCSFTLGGQGGGVAHNREQLEQLCKEGFSFSPELLIEESLIGWKEYELEVMCDRKGTCIVVCGIENLDPLGVHTGDSITVAPIQTLTDKEYQQMREMAFQVLEAIGFVAGGCNVQFAVHPRTGRLLCIEVNPRVSRSSALASKATGFPIAKIAAKLAIGYHLDELQSAFEPVIDYVVTKIPRFNFEKFPSVEPLLSTSMKSIGEEMGIGRTFIESFNKALSGSDLYPHQIAHYDPWFLEQINDLACEEQIIAAQALETVDREALYRWKQRGFSDKRLAALLHCKEEEVAQKREAMQLYPVYKRVDRCSGEFPSAIACFYSTYEEECESAPTSREKVLVLGSGPNQIGQGIEFDYCCVHAVQALKELGYESVLINCNPSTVSTDYDIADRLYIEPLTVESVCAVYRIEKPLGVLLQFGGQTALNLAQGLHQRGIPLLGTPCAALDVAEDRQRFQKCAQQLGLQQPPSGSISSLEEALELAERLGFPLILRPSYVIGGHRIAIVHNPLELVTYWQGVTEPVLMEKFLQEALEVEVEAIYDGHEVLICGILEQIEPAGVHSGNSISFLAPYRLSEELQEALKKQTEEICHALQIVGLLNVQFAIQGSQLFILEVNPRASRTIPLLSKITGMPFVRIATRCILGESLKEQAVRAPLPALLGLKVPVFPFERLRMPPGKLGPQMQATGEVLCVGKTVEELFLKAKLYADPQDTSAVEIYDMLPSSTNHLDCGHVNTLPATGTQRLDLYLDKQH
jgi:carbamoyl-phosphate synthase large subunit